MLVVEIIFTNIFSYLQISEQNKKYFSFKNSFMY